MPINFTAGQRNNLLRFLQIGKANAINAETVARHLGFPTGGNQVKTRNLIRECIEIDGDLIGASTGRPAGFFIINSVNELETYLDSLENRTRRDNDRRTALINNWSANPNNAVINKVILIIT